MSVANFLGDESPVGQSRGELDAWYANPDPWGYRTNPDDIRRKALILDAVGPGPYRRALDIGAGEGWITGDLPAATIHAYELSDKAAARLPENVERVHVQSLTYDLVLCTGVLYRQYDWRRLLAMIENVACGRVVLCHIGEWLVPEVERLAELFELESASAFPYREFTQDLRVYRRR